MDIQLTGNPAIDYRTFLFRLCSHYFETARKGEDNIDRATAALIAFFPDEEGQEELWKVYTQLRKKYEQEEDGDPQFTASCRTVGKLIAKLTDTLELTQKSNGGFL